MPASPESAPAAPGRIQTRLVEFDFVRKTEKAVDFDRFGPAAEIGNYLWLDIDLAGDAAGAKALLSDLELGQRNLVVARLRCHHDVSTGRQIQRRAKFLVGSEQDHFGPSSRQCVNHRVTCRLQGMQHVRPRAVLGLPFPFVTQT